MLTRHFADNSPDKCICQCCCDLVIWWSPKGPVRLCWMLRCPDHLWRAWCKAVCTIIDLWGVIKCELQQNHCC